VRLSIQDIHEAVNDPEWQQFRLSLKGLSTKDKLNKLGEYLDDVGSVGEDFESAKPYIRVQNYINALSRGGQIEPVDLELPVRRQLREAVIKRLQPLPARKERRKQ
jgi:hypothetical protein